MATTDNATIDGVMQENLFCFTETKILVISLPAEKVIKSKDLENYSQ
jgi:hypothetical protein